MCHSKAGKAAATRARVFSLFFTVVCGLLLATSVFDPNSRTIAALTGHPAARQDILVLALLTVIGLGLFIGLTVTLRKFSQQLSRWHMPRPPCS